MGIYSTWSLVIAIIIMIEFMDANEFGKDSGEVTIIPERLYSKPKACIDILENDPNYMDMIQEIFDEMVESKCNKKVEESYIGKLVYLQRRALCFAAQKYNPLKNVEIEFISNNIGEAQLYEIDSITKGKYERVAVKCPTSPVVFVHYLNPPKSDFIKMLYIIEKSRN